MMQNQNVRAELAAVNRQVLSGGVILTMALMPAFRSSTPLIQAAAFALAAAIALGLAATLHIWRARIWAAWESAMQATLMRMAWSEDGPVTAITDEVPVGELRTVASAA